MSWEKAVLTGLFAGLVLVVPLRRVSAEPGYGEPLTVTTGTIYRVGTVSQLKNAINAVNAVGVPATVLVSNGVYVLDVWALPMTCDDVIVRSLSGDREAVVIRGPDEGLGASTEHIFWVQADNVTIADITFGWCRYHGVQAHGQAPFDVAGLWVHNCRIVNCNEQFIKGTSADGDPEGVTDSIVEHCWFEFTNRWAYQYYTGGIDAHKAVNWVVRDNVFRYIRAPNDGAGNAEHAIHFWKRNTSRAQHIVVERNVILNCDRGIGFGLGGYNDGFEGGSSVIRNNFVYNNGEGDWTDVGIGLESAADVEVDNNTVVVPYWAPIEFRFAGSSNLVFRNNLVSDSITARDGAPAPARSNNLESVQGEWFRNLTNADLRVLPGVPAVIDQGCMIAGFSEDVDGEVRPKGAGWDIGADEYDAWNADSDGDDIVDGWEAQYGLNPTNDDDRAEDEDEDGMNNWQEWVADTVPTNSADVFSVVAGGSAGGYVVQWAAASQRVYAVYWSTNLVHGPFDALATNVAATPPLNSVTDTVHAGTSPVYYRLDVRIAH